ncbi:MAG: helix-turn-helix domain-containing protein [Saprospiraceae bacterium]
MAFKRTYHYTEEEQRLYLYAFAISYPVRQRILKRLKHNDQLTVQELFKGHRIAKSTFSGHLKILRESGLVICHEEYPHTYYCLDLKMLEDAIRYLGDFMKDDMGIGQ